MTLGAQHFNGEWVMSGDTVGVRLLPAGSTEEFLGVFRQRTTSDWPSALNSSWLKPHLLTQGSRVSLICTAGWLIEIL